MFSHVIRGFFLLSLGCILLSAQDLQAVSSDDTTSTDPYTPLTLSQNYAWSLHQMIGAGPLFGIAAGAAMDHSTHTPKAWGQGTEGFAERAGSHFGRIAVRDNLAFGIRALDHEDPRYFRSHQHGVWKRTRYAVGRSIMVRNERGGYMPAYSTLAADLATPFIAQTWRPEPISGGRELRSGGMALGFAVVRNLGQEFWPDVKKKILH